MATILVVDDSNVDCRLIADLLARDAEFQLQFAGDGREAVRLVKRCPPDVVVTDLKMPGMDGLELVGALRQEFPLIPVILMTSQGSEETALAALRAGAASYTPKSRLAEDLLDTVRSVLSVSRQKIGQARLMDRMTHGMLAFEIENDSSLIAPLVGLLQERIVRRALRNESDQIRVGIALEEALANAVYHGNLEISSELRQDDDRQYYRLARERAQMEPFRQRRVRISAWHRPEEIEFTVRDEGPGFDPGALPDPTDPENLERAFGRGLLLIQTFMDEVRHNDAGNEITMIKRQSANGNGEAEES